MHKRAIDSERPDSRQKEFDLGLLQVELALEKKVIEDIRERQKMIPGLEQDHMGCTATWGEGDLTPGCKTCCLKGKLTQVRTTTKCNLNCSFCYYFTPNDRHGQELILHDLYLINDKIFTEKDVQLLLEVQGEKYLNGIAWLHFEPLMEIDKMLPLMKVIRKRGYHQWLYTNGILATKENLKKLADAGLDEIRFNLAATSCSDKIIKNMGEARKYFKYLCIESPMFTAFYDSFMKKKDAILDTGVDHIHFAELQLFKETRDNFKDEGTLYRYRRGYVSPIKSRQLTYDVFETAARERWKNVVLFDCSNETKFFRGACAPSSAFGEVDYLRRMNLDETFYKEALQYLNIFDERKRKNYEEMLSKSDGNFADPALIYPIYLNMKG